MNKTAIILGATGLTGSLVLKNLLENKNYKEVRILNRRSVNIPHPKLKEQVGDLLKLKDYKDFLQGDEMYICIGTTKKKTPDSSVYRSIDYGIPVQATKICKANDINKIVIVSAMGANEKSSIMYNRLKGEMERDVLKENIEFTYILRPSLIHGDRKEFRLGEKVGIFLVKIFGCMIPKKYKAVHARSIAKKMIELCNSNEESKIIPSNEIH